ncbi:hypothetical protein ACIRBX_23515 [Kitasatospora sp. NPDC096147]|uniref:hypothetical protein n=1 Tax=Kitasatospora sp. NPDC096147 TaxID=3364093 RepID=UPI003825AAEB
MALGVLPLVGVILLAVLALAAGFAALGTGSPAGRLLRGLGLAVLLIGGALAVLTLPVLLSGR